MKTIPRSLASSIERDLPTLKEAVDKITAYEAAGTEIEGIRFSLDSFAGQPTLLFNACWYVTGRGVSVIVDPGIDGSPASGSIIAAA